MKKIFLIFTLLLLTASLFAQVTEVASLQAFIYGSTDVTAYDNYLSHVSEGVASANYNIYAPYDRQTNGFGNYRTPSAAEIANWTNVLTAFFMGNMATTQIYINNYNFPYEVVNFTDTDTNRNYYILREKLDMSYVDNNGTAITDDDETGGFAYSWGLYIYNPTASNPVIVTAPHVNDDFVTGPISTKCFQDWDARFLMISGCGREVKWTNANPYYNSKSLCDPSRMAIHPFNSFYKKACDEIRTAFGRKEFSAQIHSYDWNRHENHPSLQISAGNGKNHIGLPIRDLSNLNKDMINNTSFEVFAENTIGVHPMVFFNNDYYGINYNDGDFYVEYNNENVQVSNHIDLPGYSKNKQMEYTCAGYNDYDSFEPFFHVEFDELPNTYAQTENNYKWFYGYNFQTQQFDMDKIYDKAFEFYTPWIDAMTASINAMFVADTNIPTNPANLQVTAYDYNSASVKWDRSFDYDFKTYEVCYSTEPITNNNYTTLNRDNIATLAASNIPEATISGLLPNTEYHIAVKATDKANNSSEFSNEITVFTGCAKISNALVIGRNAYTEIKFTAAWQANNTGFIIERANTENGTYERIADYTNTPSLAAQNGNTDVEYTYTDDTVTNGNEYFYKIGAVSTNNLTMYDNRIFGANPQIIWDLKVSQAATNTEAHAYFGKNKYASDYWDNNFEVVHTQNDVAPFLNVRFYEQYWPASNRSMQTKINADYDEVNNSKYWLLQVNASDTSSPITLEINNLPAARNAERLYLLVSNTYIDLTQGAAQFTVPNANWNTMYLFWGNITPDITINGSENKILQPGDTHTITWNVDRNLHRAVINHFELFAVNDTDTNFPISRNITSSLDSFTYTLPDLGTVPIDNLRLELKAIMAQGDTLTFTAPYLIGYRSSRLVMSNTISTNANNWKMNAYPFTDTPITPSALYGANSTHQKFELGTYSAITALENQTAFWSYLPDDNTVTVPDANIAKTTVSKEIFYGWNLIANPHTCEYNVSQLQFVVNNQSLDFNEAVSNGFVIPAVYGYNNGYEAIKTIKPFESFWLYCEAPAINIKFTPYHQNPASLNVSNTWDIAITATQGIVDADKIVVGTATTATEGYDKFYDLPKPYQKPFDNQVNLSIEQVYLGVPITSYQQMLIDNFKTQEADSYTWNLKLKTTLLESVTISSETSNQFPDGYHVKIINGNEQFDLTTGDYTFTPTEEVTNLSLYVYNNLTNTGNNCNEYKAITCKNYPNPFNPSTIIEFNIQKDADVSLNIYNVKGQKVKTLVNNHKQAGTHTVKWLGKNQNGKTVGSGVYFYKLNVKNQKTIIKKMLLLK